jgi:predicted secreted hydrolase
VLPEGQRGFSRKGPGTREWSCYYSQPHLSVSGSVTSQGRSRAVTGVAWLDHEWADNYLAKGAPGWDWTGINFDDGSALMAFRIRARDGADYWASATFREAGRDAVTSPPFAVRFEPLRTWRSPHTGASYPVAMRLHIADRELELQPLMDDQELDSRASVGAVYWEGAVEVKERGRRVGRGFLELTGYVSALKV